MCADCRFDWSENKKAGPRLSGADRLFVLRNGANRLTDQPKLRLAAHPAWDLHPLLLRFTKMIQVLLKRRLVELSQEIRADAGVDLTDIVDELTFIHGLLRLV